MTTYRIPEQNLEILTDKIEKLAKIAKRIGALDVPALVAFSHEDDAPDKNGRVQRWYTVEVTGEAPRFLGGWRLAGTIEHLAAGNLLRAVPGTDIPERFREIGTDQCDGCGQRRFRTDTYAVVSEAGEFAHVGGQCIKKYLGYATPASLAAWAELLHSIEQVEDPEWEGGSARWPERYAPTVILAQARAAIRVWGWTPAGQAWGTSRQSTRDNVLRCLHPGPDEHKLPFAYREELESARAITDEDRQAAAQAWEWAQALSVHDTNDYIRNLAVLGREPSWAVRHLGLGCSIIKAYERAQNFAEELRVKAQERAARPTSHYVGVAGERRQFTLTVRVVIELSSDFGPQTKYVFSDTDGNVFVWKRSKAHESWLDRGNTVTVKGTIKGHSEFKGEQQTIIERCKA